MKATTLCYAQVFIYSYLTVKQLPKRLVIDVQLKNESKEAAEMFQCLLFIYYLICFLIVIFPIGLNLAFEGAHWEVFFFFLRTDFKSLP